MPAPPVAAAAAAGASWTSASRPDVGLHVFLSTRPCGPVAVTALSSTPNSRASWRGRAGMDLGAVGARRCAGLPAAAADSEAMALTSAATAGLAPAGTRCTGWLSCAAGAGAAAGAAPAVRSLRIRSPVPTSVSSLTTMLSTACGGRGISMLALSDSRVIRLWSASTRSPALTRISITLALLSEPMSGTWTSCTASAAGAAGAAGGPVPVRRQVLRRPWRQPGRRLRCAA